ncbi:MAG: hypothetical protein ACREA8_08245, partial [Nitrosotalea sp.]
SYSSDNGSIANRIVMPGNFPDFFCQGKSSGYDAVIINQTGFTRSEPDHLYFGHMHVYDYMLLPDHNATITYALQNGTSSDLTNGDVTFFHDGGQQDHLGLTVQSSPVFNVTGGIGETMLFSASALASHGTYWMTLPPAYCASGMVILFTVGESISPNLSIPSSFTSSMDKQTYSRSDDMLVKILGVPYNILQLTIFSDNSHIVTLNDTIMIDPDGESAYWLHANNFPDNEYTVILNSQNKTSTIHFTIEPKTETVSSMSNATTYGISNNTEIQKSETQYANQISSPLKQFKSGISASKVVCNQGFQLILKREDNSPACVKSDTASILVEREWYFPLVLSN